MQNNSASAAFAHTRAIPGETELFPVVAKKLPAAAPKFPAPTAQGIGYKPLRHSDEMAFESPSRMAIRETSLQKYPAGREQRLPTGIHCRPALWRHSRHVHGANP
jgi:hypothetical protein